MKTYKISKRKVKEAIITESLQNGSFFQYEERDNGKCAVCAVGAVLRNTKPKTFTEADCFEVTENKAAASRIDEAYDSRNFLAILSSEFEYHSDHYNCTAISPNSKEMKMFLLFLTEAYCPKTLEFSVK